MPERDVASNITWTLATLLALSASTPLLAADSERPYPQVGGETNEVTLYNADAQHLWNRLHETLFVRQLPNGKYAGHDELDPLLWYGTTHLLEGESYDAATGVLDEFLASDRSIDDPLKRAVLQNDLWFVFDWLLSNKTNRAAARRTLTRRVALAIKMVALTQEEIAELPDNRRPTLDATGLASTFNPDAPNAPFFPVDVFANQGPWICLSRRSGQDTFTARLHVRHEGARSTFAVFMRLPGGRTETLKYLNRLNLFDKPITLVENPVGHIKLADGSTHVRRDEVIRVNKDVPQFTDGTQFALLRMMVLIDDQGNITPTNIIRQLQTRVYLDADRNVIPDFEQPTTMVCDEFRMSRKLLLAKHFGLRHVARDEPTFGHFFSHDEQQVLRGPSIQTCNACHSRAGIQSVNTYTFGHGFREDLAPTLMPTTLEREAELIVAEKRSRYDWGVLETLLAD